MANGVPAAMRLRISEPRLVQDLVDYLTSRGDVVAVAVSDDEVDISLLGSYRDDSMRMEVELRLRAWEAGRSAIVEFE